jgi:hypothetical protein
MGGSDCARPSLGFVDQVLQVGKRLCLPVHSFTAKRQTFGFRIDSDKRQNIRIVFESRLEAAPRNGSGAFHGGNASRQHALRRLNDSSALSNNLGLIPTHNRLGLGSINWSPLPSYHKNKTGAEDVGNSTSTAPVRHVSGLNP